MTATLDDARARADQLDRDDPIGPMAERFHLPEGLIYLDGNSLGPAPKAALREVETALHTEWAEQLITSWNTAGWFDIPTTYGDLLAPVIGAAKGEVLLCDTTTLNSHKVLHAALNMRPDRPNIVAEADSFPTNLYAAEGVAGLAKRHNLRLEGRDADRVEDLIDADAAVVFLNHINYRTGRVRDMGELTKLAHDSGTLAIWDLCHSAGVFDVRLNEANADFAVGCTYKYLNGGPGGPAYLFAASRHIPEVNQPLTGWWGHAAPFGFEPSHRPDSSIRKFLSGTQHILSMRGARAGLELAAEQDLAQVRAKSMALTDLFTELAVTHCTDYGIGLFSPRDADNRGSQVALTHYDAYAVMQALIDRKVIGDFRMPNILRFGFAPLYISYRDVVEAVAILREVLATEEWRDARFQTRSAVT
jgi:kynureninase